MKKATKPGSGVRPLRADWRDIPVSMASRAGEPLWHLDIRTPGVRADELKIRWRSKRLGEISISKRELTGLIDAAKAFLSSMIQDPPPGRRRWSQRTIKANSGILLALIDWMAVDGVRAFAELDKSSIRRMRTWLGSRRGRRENSTLSLQTVRCYFWVLRAFYEQRHKLLDAPLRQPDATAAQRMRTAGPTNTGIPAIPDAIAVSLLSAALKWVECHAGILLEAADVRYAAVQDLGRSAAARASARALEGLRSTLTDAHLAGPCGSALEGAVELKAALKYLRDACFVVIGGFVGMRASEVLSLRMGAIELRRDAQGGEQAYVVGRLFKTSDARDGRVERWIAPPPVVQAVQVLERLTAPIRAVTGRTELFLTPPGRGHQAGVTTVLALSVRMNKFSRCVGVPLHNGVQWRFSTHQLRKTFARFVGKRDRTQLMALSEHFKHVSLAMTARSYVGTDFDLRELVDEQGRAETASALERLLTSDQLAGRTGERISEKGALFRGRAGEQVRKDYISFVLRETDLRIHACDYGWCVFQAETTKCGGRTEPDEAMRSPSVCLSCSNMVVEAQHAPYWRERRERHAALLPAASLLTRSVLVEGIEQCDGVLRKIGANGAKERRKEGLDRTDGDDCKSLPSGSRKVGSGRRAASATRRAVGTRHASGSSSRGRKKP